MPANHGSSEAGVSASLFGVALISACLAAIAWSLIRAYTGIFDVLNLRVFVASAVLVLPLFLMPALAFSLSGWRRIFVPVIPIMAMVPVAGGEWLGMALSGQAIVWQKFNLIWLGLGIGFALMGCIGVFFKNDLLK
ncbi:MAG: hypothetical protein HY244_10320 [Rhizobiales bacterium]|nr:hypothetical protein [Hyphomicrobiales bacterium]